MRTAIDTNVLVRYLTWDDAGQAEEATHVIENASTVVISTMVLCETVWVLKRAYGYTTTEITEALRGVIASQTVETDRVAAEAGLTMLSRGGDFADGVIAQVAEQAGCDRIATFDRNFARLAAGPASLCCWGALRRAHNAHGRVPIGGLKR
jgi:predicted nucleic-acid-binding protein